MATVGSLVVKIGADISGFEKGLGTVQTRLQSAGRSMQSLGAGLTLGLTAPIVGIATAALNSAAGFEKSMNLMQTMSGATGAQMVALQEQALALGQSTVFSAGEAADAMLELSKAGLSVEQVGGAIPGVLDLAAAANLGLAEDALEFKHGAAVAQEVDGKGVPELVDVRSRHAGAFRARHHKVPQRTRDEWCAGSRHKERVSGFGLLSLSHVAPDRLASRLAHEDKAILVSLAMADLQATGLPIEIFDEKVAELRRAQSRVDEYEQNGPVAQLPVALALDLLPRWCLPLGVFRA